MFDLLCGRLFVQVLVVVGVVSRWLIVQCSVRGLNGLFSSDRFVLCMVLCVLLLVLVLRIIVGCVLCMVISCFQSVILVLFLFRWQLNSYRVVLCVEVFSVLVLCIVMILQFYVSSICCIVFSVLGLLFIISIWVFLSVLVLLVVILVWGVVGGVVCVMVMEKVVLWLSMLCSFSGVCSRLVIWCVMVSFNFSFWLLLWLLWWNFLNIIV